MWGTTRSVEAYSPVKEEQFARCISLLVNEARGEHRRKQALRRYIGQRHALVGHIFHKPVCSVPRRLDAPDVADAALAAAGVIAENAAAAAAVQYIVVVAAVAGNITAVSVAAARCTAVAAGGGDVVTDLTIEITDGLCRPALQRYGLLDLCHCCDLPLALPG